VSTNAALLRSAYWILYTPLNDDVYALFFTGSSIFTFFFPNLKSTDFSLLGSKNSRVCISFFKSNYVNMVLSRLNLVTGRPVDSFAHPCAKAWNSSGVSAYVEFAIWPIVKTIHFLKIVFLKKSVLKRIHFENIQFLKI
jgi:hypothetical protein